MRLEQVFSCKFLKFLKTPFLQNTSVRLLLKKITITEGAHTYLQLPSAFFKKRLAQVVVKTVDGQRQFSIVYFKTKDHFVCRHHE